MKHLLLFAILLSSFLSTAQLIKSAKYSKTLWNACSTPDSKKMILSYVDYTDGRLSDFSHEIYDLPNGSISSETYPGEVVFKFSNDYSKRLCAMSSSSLSFKLLIKNQNNSESTEILKISNNSFPYLRIFADRELKNIIFQDLEGFHEYNEGNKLCYDVFASKKINFSTSDIKYLPLTEFKKKKYQNELLGVNQIFKELNSSRKPLPINQSLTDFRVAIISTDQKKLIIRSADSLIIRNTADFKLLYSTPLKRHIALAISPDDRFILTGFGDPDQTLGIWSIDGDEIKFVKSITNFVSNLSGLIFSANSKFLITNSLKDKTFQFWNFSALIDKVVVTDKSDLSQPPFLSVEANTIKFKDSNENGQLEANEKATISFKVKNSGKGSAKGLSIETRLDRPSSSIILKPEALGTIEPGSIKDVTVNLSAGIDVLTQLNRCSIKVIEPNGLDCQPVEISFNSLKFQEPKLIISEGLLSSNDGSLLKLNTPASLEISVVNDGAGIAENVEIKLSHPSEVLLLNKPFEKVKLGPGESTKVKFEFIVTSRFQGTDVKIKVTTTEQFLKYGATKDISLKVNEPLSIAKFTVAQTAEPIPTKKVIATKSADPEVSTTLESNPVFYALLIGISDYRNSNSSLVDLDKPVEDASLLYKTLTDSYTFNNDRVYLLKNPTRTEIIDMMENLSKKITVKDNLLIFYAGHGYWDEKLKIGYWLPSDAEFERKSTWISNSNIKDYIAGINSKHSLLVTDACFSGSIFKSRSVESLNSYSVSKLYSSPSRKAMTSGNLTTVPDKSKFIEYINKALLENKDKYLSVRQLFNTIYTPVLNNSSTVPLYGVMQDTGDEGGEFIFIRK